MSQTGADPGFFVCWSKFSDVMKGEGGEKKVLKIMLVIKYRLVREALVILGMISLLQRHNQKITV